MKYAGDSTIAEVCVCHNKMISPRISDIAKEFSRELNVFGYAYEMVTDQPVERNDVHVGSAGSPEI